MTQVIYLRRADQLKTAGYNPRAVEECLIAVKKFNSALAVSVNVSDKVNVHLRLGESYDRLTTLVPEEAAEWQKQSRNEYETVIELTRNNSGSGLVEASQKARQRLEEMSSKKNVNPN